MCNLYSVTTNQQAIRALNGIMSENDLVGNLGPLPEVYPNTLAPIVRNGPKGRELAMALWGVPTPPYLSVKDKSKDTDPRTIRDLGTTNIQNTKLGWWRQWFDIENRCVVPFNSFAEPEGEKGQPIWFARDENRPLLWCAGIWVPNWTSIRKVKDGQTTNDLFGFLTTGANNLVGTYHNKAMPAILTTTAEVDHWMSAPNEEACSSSGRCQMTRSSSLQEGGSRI
jgi:putative SOS response-associated peptidase YedK